MVIVYRKSPLTKKTNEMVMGKYGKKTHTWKLAESEV